MELYVDSLVLTRRIRDRLDVVEANREDPRIAENR